MWASFGRASPSFPTSRRRSSRDWWGTLYSDFVSKGIAGFWNDMNEPAIFEVASKTMPDDVQHRIEEPGFITRTTSHLEVHNIFGMQNSRGTFEGLLKINPDSRPFVMTRASYAGGQRYAATWTGDNSSTWNHLRQTTPQLINLGLSGFAMSGADVGGFAGSPQPELLTRWLEVAAFHPIDRDHTADGTNPQEPWENGTQEDVNLRRRYIEERYHLLPYLYTTAEEMSRTGLPIMRPLFLEFPAPTAMAARSTWPTATSLCSVLICWLPRAPIPTRWTITRSRCRRWVGTTTGQERWSRARRAERPSTIPQSSSRKFASTAASTRFRSSFVPGQLFPSSRWSKAPTKSRKGR